MVIVVPFRAGGKTRFPAELRVDVALAMLGDVVEAAVAAGDVRVVTDDPAGRLVATELGVIPEPVTPLLVVLVVPGAVLVANLVALAPARVAARTRPAVALRSE